MSSKSARYALLNVYVSSGLFSLRLGESSIGIEIVADVGPPTLNQMPRQLAADPFAFSSVEIGGKWVTNSYLKQTEKRTERLLVAAVRRGRDQDQMACWICSDTAATAQIAAGVRVPHPRPECSRGPHPQLRIRGI